MQTTIRRSMSAACEALPITSRYGSPGELGQAERSEHGKTVEHDCRPISKTTLVLSKSRGTLFDNLWASVCSPIPEQHSAVMHNSRNQYKRGNTCGALLSGSTKGTANSKPTTVRPRGTRPQAKPGRCCRLICAPLRTIPSCAKESKLCF